MVVNDDQETPLHDQGKSTTCDREKDHVQSTSSKKGDQEDCCVVGAQTTTTTTSTSDASTLVVVKDMEKKPTTVTTVDDDDDDDGKDTLHEDDHHGTCCNCGSHNTMTAEDHDDDDEAQATTSTPLLCALAKNGDYEMMKETLSSRVGDSTFNIDIVDEKDGRTALFWSVLQNDVAMVKLLLSHKANPNLTDKEGFFPLWIASQDGYTEIVTLLLQHGANVNQQVPEDFGGTTSLFMSILESHYDCIRTLLEYHANVNIAEMTSGTSLLQIAEEVGDKDIIKLLYQHGAMYTVSCMACPPTISQGDDE